MFVAALLFAGVVAGSPVFPESAATQAALMPPDWKLVDSAVGDLNQDGIADSVLVIQATNQDLIEETDHPNGPLDHNPRVLGVFFGKKGGGFDKELEHLSLIPRRSSPDEDELFKSITIGKSGVLELGYSYWTSAGSWWTTSWSYLFRYQEGEFALIGYEHSAGHRASGELTETSINFSTRKMKISYGSLHRDAPDRVEWRSFVLPELRTLPFLNSERGWEFQGLQL